jgi:hypothetical protein
MIVISFRSRLVFAVNAIHGPFAASHKTYRLAMKIMSYAMRMYRRDCSRICEASSERLVNPFLWQLADHQCRMLFEFGKIRLSLHETFANAISNRQEARQCIADDENPSPSVS